MSVLKTEYMTRKEIDFFQAVEEFSYRQYGLFCEPMNEEERSFTERIDEILNRYSWNLFEQNKLNELIYSIRDPGQWKDFFQNRAVRLGALYEENESILREIKEALDRPMNEIIARFWVEMLRIHFNNRGIGDIHCTVPILDRVIPRLEEYQDWQGLCMAYVFYSNFLFTTMFNINDGTPYLYVRKLVGIREHYREMNASYAIYEAYKNLYFYGLREKKIEPEEAYRLVVEMQDFHEMNQADEQMRQRCQMVYDTCVDYWLSVIDAYTDEAAPDIQEYYCRLAADKYEKISLENVPLEQQLFPYYAYELHAEVIRGGFTFDDALEKLFRFYCDNFEPYFGPQERETAQEIDEIEKRNISCGISENQELLNNLLLTVIILERWTHKCADGGLVRRVTDKLIADIPKFYKFYTNVPLELSQELTGLCFALLPCLGDAERKERWILELVTKKQFATHLHSVMVQKIAVMVAESLYGERPELFDRVKEEIGGKPLIEFVSKCALFHDVGKNDIATIVNIQARALDDMEFEAIRKHPYFGYRRLMEDPDFDCYKDAVLFHHKTYDGKGGYPFDMDNTASPYRIVVDLISISDCFDAATDTLGRSYKRAKTVDGLLEELDRDAGVRYNPDIVRHIKDHPELRDKLKRLIEDERLDTAYQIAYEYQ